MANLLFKAGTVAHLRGVHLKAAQGKHRAGQRRIAGLRAPATAPAI